jgi:hypothetical protein
MKFSLHYIICMVLFVCASCQSSTPRCGLRLKDLLDQHKDVIEIQSENRYPDFRDKGIDSAIGGYYTFYENGILKEYLFFVRRDTVNYREQFDSLGNIMHIYGEPLLRKTAEVSGDSLIIAWHFFALNKDYQSVDLITEKGITSLQFAKDSLFSNAEIVRHVIKGLVEEQDIDGYLIVKFKNRCTGELKTIRENMGLHFKP